MPIGCGFLRRFEIAVGLTLSFIACGPAPAGAAEPNLPIRFVCTYDAVGKDPAYEVTVAFDEKAQKFYTSRGGKIASATVTGDAITILHMVTPPDGERELTTTAINRHTGKVVLTREGGGVLGTGTCVKVKG
jgi:hypothetical protein